MRASTSKRDHTALVFVRLAIAFVSSIVIAACSNDPPMPSPSPPPSSTRVIGLSGNLAFGEVEIGASKESVLTISNTGNATLTVTGMTGPSGYSASWTIGTIAAGGSQAVTLRFAPTAEQTYDGTLTVSADQTSGGNTTAVSGRGIRAVPKTQFGPGVHLVGTDIAPGRYYSDPRSGCYWERLSGLGGTFPEVLANEFIDFDAGQWIVEILPGDKAFRTEEACGTWFNTPRRGLDASIGPGVWLVGSQVSLGVYRAAVRAGCYWERKQSFLGTLSDIIANDFIDSPTQARTEVRSGDLGFRSDDECGTWARDPMTTAPEHADRESANMQIEANWIKQRQKTRHLGGRF